MDDPYAIDAEYYDLIHAARQDDVGLWLAYAGATDRPVLEVGCGTGRVAVEMAKAGHDVTGIDPSAAMLAIARQKASDDAVDVTFVEGRAQDLALERNHYGFVLVPADVFLYCEDGDEQESLLRALAAAVNFGGTVAVDLPGPAAWMDEATNGQPVLAWSGELPGGAWLDAWHVHEDDPADQTRTLRVMYDVTAAGGVLTRRSSTHRLRYVFPHEARLLCRASGLEVRDVLGGYDLEPLTAASERMIVVARRAGE